MRFPLRTQLGCFLLLGAATPGMAAENLPPLRVDPALLGPPLPSRVRPPSPPSPAAPPVGPLPERASSDGVTPVPAAMPERIAPAEGTGPAAIAAPTRAERARGKAARQAPVAALRPAEASVAATPAPARSTEPPPRVPAVPARREEEAAPAPARETEPPRLAQPHDAAGRPSLPSTRSAHGAAGALSEPELKPAPVMAPLPRGEEIAYPTFVSADRITGRNDVELVAEGDVELRKTGSVVYADKLTYWQLDDEVEAVGNVRLTRDEDRLAGPKMRLKLEENVGYFEQPEYSLTRMPKLAAATPGIFALPGAPAPAARQPVTGRGEAERIDFAGEGLYRLSKASYSTCAPDRRDWYARTDSLELDYNREVGEARDATLVFKGVPLLYSPWLSFSLNNQRKSGLLAPTLGSSTRSGFEMTLPWYWNIAPNMDATISPRIMTKRGVQWNGEFRYLDHGYTGQARVEYLPNDNIENKRRSGYAVMHTQNFGNGFTGLLNLNGVSDDNYFRDLSTRVSAVSQGNLLRHGQLAYGATWWNAALNLQRYQTLQDPAYPTATPYYRLPQFNLAANRYDLPAGLAAHFAGEFVNFGHPTSVIGKRWIAYPQVSLPFQTAAFHLTPKIGLHYTRYTLERQGLDVPADQTRSVPTFSVDSGVVFERDMSLFGRGLTQTLEPRLFYTYIAKREQGRIPVFDTALADFNFAQIFAENRYIGGDRLGDANQLTAAVVSRLIDPGSGAELLRGAVGQRYYFTTQHVTLPGETARTSRTADLLAALSGQVAARTYVDTGWQYNPRDGRTERFSLGGRYQPDLAKVMNASYRYTRDQLGQIDLSGQWPVGGGWYGVGRYNYSTKERRVVETIGGLEYDGGCWVARFVVQRLATQVNNATTAFFVQLELNGFSRIGSNPLDMLRRNIPGYGLINQPTASPVFGAN